MPSKKKGRGKGKAKKAAARAEAEAERAAKRRVEEASWVDPDADVPVPRDALADFVPPAFHVFKRNGISASFQFGAGNTLSPALSDWVVALTEGNMKTLYEESGWGWKGGEKRRELLDAEARYLVLFEDADGSGGAGGASSPGESKKGEGVVEVDGRRPLAFIHFRFLLEDSDEVLYVYECQVEQRVRRKGLGMHLMLMAEVIAKKAAMKYVMLTVLNINTPALRFYKERLRYQTDASSPSTWVDDESPYQILSKCVDPATLAAIKAEQAAEAEAKAVGESKA